MYNAFETAEFGRIIDLAAILHLLQKKNTPFLQLAAFIVAL